MVQISEIIERVAKIENEVKGVANEDRKGFVQCARKIKASLHQLAHVQKKRS